MDIRIISLIITFFLLVISLFGCGVSSPTGANGFGSPAGIPGPSGISFSAVFPTRSPATVPGLNPLISASTSTIKISIQDTGGRILGSATVTSASPSAMIPVTGYVGAVKVYITSYDSTANITASHIHDASIYSGMTTPISVALVEFRQGVTGIGGVTLMAPDGSSYTLTDLFLAPTGTSYQLGVKATKAAAVGYHLSTQNMDQTTPNGTNPPNTQLFVVNDNLSFPIDVPNASKTVWNRYQININFMNGLSQTGTSIPTASPTVTGTFVGAFSAPNTPVTLAPAPPVANGLLDITWTGTQFVAVGRGATVLTSPDNLNWVKRTTPVTNNLASIIWTGTQFVATGALGTIITSPDAINWTKRVTPFTNTINSVAYSPTLKYVAVDAVGNILVSPDSINWTTTAAAGLPLLWVIWDSPRAQFVAVGNGGTIITSTNGVTWSLPQTSGTTVPLNNVISTPTQLVVVGVGTVLTSPTGTTWTVQTSPTPNSMWSIAWSGTKYVAIDDFGGVFSSTNLTAWTTGNAGTTSMLYSVIWASTQFVAVSTIGEIISSTDGINWSKNPVGGVGFSIPNAPWAAYAVPTLPLAPPLIIF